MAYKKRPKIFYVDSNYRLFTKMNEAVYNAGFQNTCFRNPHACFKQLVLQNCELLVCNCKMPGMNGIEVLKAAKRLIPWQPVMLINGTSRDLPAVIEAIKEGAIDVLTKPFNMDVFIKTIKTIIKNHHKTLSLYHSLTNMEKDVLKLVMLGKNFDESTALLGCKGRT